VSPTSRNLTVEETCVNTSQNVFDFLIIALAVFGMVKIINSLKKAPAPEAAPEPTAEEKLLTEIRDLLKK